jgi:hypothetical protein
MAYPPYQNRIYGHAWFSAQSNATIALTDASSTAYLSIQVAKQSSANGTTI